MRVSTEEMNKSKKKQTNDLVRSQPTQLSSLPWCSLYSAFAQTGSQSLSVYSAIGSRKTRRVRVSEVLVYRIEYFARSGIKSGPPLISWEKNIGSTSCLRRSKHIKYCFRS